MTLLSRRLHLYLEESWNEALEQELAKPYLAQLGAFLQSLEAEGIPFYPPKEDLFNAFFMTPYSKVKVLIMGQDPYHGPGQAHGMSFSVRRGVPLPPSLVNIFKELGAELQVPMPKHGCLESWAKQGVLLLNAILSVEAGKPLSHQRKGWEWLTDAVVRVLCERKDPVIFVLWGRAAKQKLLPLTEEYQVDPKYILEAPHPSPLSAHYGFFGCGHFARINELLAEMGKEPIQWALPP